MATNIPVIRHDEPWQSPNVDSWRQAIRAQVLENDRRITSQFLGVLDQTTDVVSPGGGNLPAASALDAGSYYVLEVTGVFAVTNAPELNGQNGGAGDTIISDGTVWILLPQSQDFLSSVVADTATGVITFDPAPISNTAAALGTELVRKQEMDASDTVVTNYSDAQDAAHAALQADPDDVHGTKAYSDAVMAGHVAVDGVGGPHVHPQHALIRNVVTYFPWKALATQFNGLLVQKHSFNVAGITNPSAGVYRIEIEQNTIEGTNIAEFLIPLVSIITPDSVGESVFAKFQPGAPAGFVDIYTFTLTISGQNLFDTDYVLGPNDTLWLLGLLNVIDANSDPLPP